MKRIAVFFAAFAALIAGPAFAAEPITGKWKTQEGDSIVTISRCGQTYCGRLTRYLVMPEGGVDQRDVNNPDPAKRKRKVLGTALLIGFTQDGDEWRGRIYDPRNGKNYRSVLRRKNAGTLEVKGCVGPFCQTQNWTRVP